MKCVPIHGGTVETTKPYQADKPTVKVDGFCGNEKSYFSLDEQILSKHLLLVGGTGCGKTNMFYHIVSQLKKGIQIVLPILRMQCRCFARMKTMWP